MRHYELVVVLSPMLNQEQASTAWGRIKDFITNRSAELDHEETWGTRRLAYAIKKGPYHFLEGSYHLTRFSADTPFNQELLTFLRLDEQVLRSLLTVTGPPQLIPEPAPVAQVAVAEHPADETVDTALAAVAPEAVAPEAVAPEAVAPEAVAPEAVAPEAVAPEAVAPEAVAPEAVAPEAVAPEAVAPEAVARPSASAEVEPEPVPAAVAVAEAPILTEEAAEGPEAGGDEPSGGEQTPA